MKSTKTALAVCIASVMALGMSASQAVSFSDPKGDDNGPGNYIYPTDAVYKSGSFDLTKLSVKKKGDNAEFAVDVNSSLEDPWGMGNGFAVQMVFIFIKTGPGGHSEGLPGLNVKFAPGSEWNKVVVLSPQKKARVIGEASTKAPDLLADILVPNTTRGSNRTIKGLIPLSELGGDGNVDGWSYQVVMQSNEGFPAATDLLTRKVNEYEGQHRFGGGNDGDCDAHVMDVLESDGAKQVEMLSSTCGPNGETTKPATLKLISK
ncbi:MAG: glucodextranase DOMON-like domain-containing protein [Sideroxydans sp.]|nr:glucodextranase DOMON-like domain-containing protein [Sideroxydans sp.]